MRALLPSEKNLIFDTVAHLLSVRCLDELLGCINGNIRRLLGHNSFVCGIGRFRTEGLESKLLLSDNFPEAYLKSIAADGYFQPQTLQFWAEAEEPMAFNRTDAAQKPLPERMIDSALKFDLFNLLCHGQRDYDRRHISYLVLAGIGEPVGDRHCSILANVMPHLHNSLLRLCNAEIAKAPPVLALERDDRDSVAKSISLKLRYMQVIYLLSIGKTNWEIAQVLNTSIDNVKYHIKQLNGWLGTTSRTGIVSMAAQRKLTPKRWPERLVGLGSATPNCRTSVARGERPM